MKEREWVSERGVDQGADGWEVMMIKAQQSQRELLRVAVSHPEVE